MNGKRNLRRFGAISAIIGGLAVSGLSGAYGQAESLHYQGRLTVGGQAHDGAADFKFALYDPGTAQIVWSNDGTTGAGGPSDSVTLDVDKGLFSVSLGSAPMPPIDSELFGGNPLVLRVWADAGSGMALLAPDQKIEPVGLAHMAESVPDRAITSAKLENGAVTASKISNGAVTSGKIASGAITGAAIASGAVASGHIASGSISNDAISPNAKISASKLNDGAGSGLDADFLDGVSGAGYLRADTDATFSGDRLTVEKDLRIPSLSRVSFENGASSILGLFGSISITSASNGDIILNPGDDVIVTGDVSLDGATFSVDSNANAVGVGTGSPVSRLHVVGRENLEEAAVFEARAAGSEGFPTSAVRVRTVGSGALVSGFGTGISLEAGSVGSGDPTIVGVIDGILRKGAFPLPLTYGQVQFRVRDVSGVFGTPMVLSSGGCEINGELGASMANFGNLRLSDSVYPNLAEMNRISNGTYVDFDRDSIPVGSISLSGTTVSYNAFTGSHYGHTEDRIESGCLVAMTGENRFHDDDSEGEPHYGVGICSEENSTAVLGVYGGRVHGDEEGDQWTNPHLINAAGNAHVWIVDTGVDIRPGDYLISSSVPGHAQLDGRTSAESHVIGRAAEPVEWGEVSETTEFGVRHAKITMLFGSFARYNPPEVRGGLASSDVGSMELGE